MGVSNIIVIAGGVRVNALLMNAGRTYAIKTSAFRVDSGFVDAVPADAARVHPVRTNVVHADAGFFSCRSRRRRSRDAVHTNVVHAEAGFADHVLADAVCVPTLLTDADLADAALAGGVPVNALVNALDIDAILADTVLAGAVGVDGLLHRYVLPVAGKAPNLATVMADVQNRHAIGQRQRVRTVIQAEPAKANDASDKAWRSTCS